MPGFKPKGGGGKGKLSGGHWVTIHGHPAYIKGGKVVAGGIPGVTHDKGGTPHGTPHHTSSSIPMRPKKGGVKDSTATHDPERAKDEAKSRKEYRKAGEAHAAARADHAAAKKALADHDRTVKGHAAKSDGLKAKHAAGEAKLAEHRAAIAGHDAKIAELKGKLKPGGGKPGKPVDHADKALADAEHARAVQKAARASQQIKDADRAQRAADAAHSAKSAGTSPGPGKPGPSGKSTKDEVHTPESYAKKHGIGGANAFAHLDTLHRAGKIAHDKNDGSYFIPKGTASPRAAASTATSTVKPSAPRNAQESAIHADAKARGKAAMVVTSTPQYHAEKSGGTTHHQVGGKTVASSHVDASGKHVIVVHNDDGTHHVYRHRTKDGAHAHLATVAKAAIRKGTTRHAVVGGDLSKFDHRAHGIGGAHHKVTGRVLGDGKKK